MTLLCEPEVTTTLPEAVLPRNGNFSSWLSNSMQFQCTNNDTLAILEQEYFHRKLLDVCAFIILLALLSLILPIMTIKCFFNRLFLRERIQIIAADMKYNLEMKHKGQNYKINKTRWKKYIS